MQIDQYEQIKLSSSLKKPFNNQIQKTPKNKKNNKIQRKHNNESFLTETKTTLRILLQFLILLILLFL